ncbi:hypothetical protein BDV39DRAFT_179149 [Aspergillus sergii]|uniref:Uncharacterized protein n=1 Tax=Aspergillus sergii TaxID=1034303 RepID=A0A5N6WYT8_9EURO|nr:hypothetical protein BDV39DRAFT_179149 [Aspergillus sergii]
MQVAPPAKSRNRPSLHPSWKKCSTFAHRHGLCWVPNSPSTGMLMLLVCWTYRDAGDCRVACWVGISLTWHFGCVLPFPPSAW